MDLGTSGIRGQMQHGGVLLPSALHGNSPATGVASTVNSLETVRALHQTVVSLRAALEQSRSELHSLRSQFQSKLDPLIYTSTIEKLSLENHILRQKVLSSSYGNIKDLFSLDRLCSPRILVSSYTSMDQDTVVKTDEESSQGLFNEVESSEEQKNNISILQNEGNSSEKVDDGEDIDVCDKIMDVNGDLLLKDCSTECKIQEEDNSLSSTGTGTTPKVTKGESEESEELDDIELIFTTEETKELTGGEFHEDLVSIPLAEGWQKCSQDKTEKLKKMWATQSVLVETDISKCGVVDENDPAVGDYGRRNTLPNPAPYRPIIHREALTGSKSQLLDNSTSNVRPVAVKFSQITSSIPRAIRPILAESNPTKQESETQTDITALPAHWKSESYLAHKVSYNFTTLPSKFALPEQSPPPRKQSLKLCEKTQEARRVLLSDINFTSMVPELSRSADHLCNEGINAALLCKNYPRAFSYMKNPETIISPGYLNRVPWSPCDCNHRQSSWECYHSSGTSVHSPSAMDLVEGAKRRHSMRPSASSTDAYWGSINTRPNWSVPSSPTHCRRSQSIPLNRTESSFSYGRSDVYYPRRSESRCVVSSCTPHSSSARMKNHVTFQGLKVRRPGQSLPDLRLTGNLDSDLEDSTDSLIDESEEYLRQSIDSMKTGLDSYRNSNISSSKISSSHIRTHRRSQFTSRRHSDPDPFRGFEPPKSAQPFLAKLPRDLKLDYFVKVITAEGKVTVGRVRYIGPVSGQNDPFVGVQLPHGEGNSDGSYEGKRYFDCEPDCAIFVPFKKVVMAWST